MPETLYVQRATTIPDYSSEPFPSYPTYLNYSISYIMVGAMKNFSMQYIRNYAFAEANGSS
jgi:hypothetical protein